MRTALGNDAASALVQKNDIMNSGCYDCYHHLISSHVVIASSTHRLRL